MKIMKTKIIAIVLMAFSGLFHAIAFAADVRGSHDDPLLGRFEGAEIRVYKHFKYDEIPYITGPFSPQSGKIDKVENIGGELSLIGYYIPKGASFAQLEHNYNIRLKQQGFVIDYQCNSDKNECSGEQLYAPNFFKYIRMPTKDMDQDHYLWNEWKYRYIAAHLDGPTGRIYAIVVVTNNGFTGEPLFVYVTLLKKESMEYSMVDAKKMAKSIADTGRIALYGIHFDTAKADIKPDSEQALQQISALLKQQPDLKLVIVGHTDNQGALDYNMTLSKKRADAVRDALIKQYGIAASRLAAWGAGYLAPVASNHTEAGRAKNRRVELVEQ
jgi:OOP family OmpA-OmpF porin